jgi:hypothetical protein
MDKVIPLELLQRNLGNEREDYVACDSEVRGSSRPKNIDLFLNARAEAWYGLRNSLMKGEVTVPNDPELIKQLSTPFVRITGMKKYAVESVYDMGRRGERPLDKADSYVFDN